MTSVRTFRTLLTKIHSISGTWDSSRCCFRRHELSIARVIPLDTGLSNYFQRFPLNLDYSFDLRNIGHFYRTICQAHGALAEGSALKMIEISYEEMILNTEQTARKTLEFSRVGMGRTLSHSSHQPMCGGNGQPMAGAPANLPPLFGTVAAL